MTRSALAEYAAVTRRRYKAGRKAEKTKILDEFCQTTGMHRKDAVRLLNRETKPRPLGRGRPRRYGVALLEQVHERINPQNCNDASPAPCISYGVSAVEPPVWSESLGNPTYEATLSP